VIVTLAALALGCGVGFWSDISLPLADGGSLGVADRLGAGLGFDAGVDDG
jgi:hypothetical protein